MTRRRPSCPWQPPQVRRQRVAVVAAQLLCHHVPLWQSPRAGRQREAVAVPWQPLHVRCQQVAVKRQPLQVRCQRVVVKRPHLLQPLPYDVPHYHQPALWKHSEVLK